jgi:hypothetical protein
VLISCFAFTADPENGSNMNNFAFWDMTLYKLVKVSPILDKKNLQITVWLRAGLVPGLFFGLE